MRKLMFLLYATAWLVLSAGIFTLLWNHLTTDSGVVMGSYYSPGVGLAVLKSRILSGLGLCGSADGRSWCWTNHVAESGGRYVVKYAIWSGISAFILILFLWFRLSGKARAKRRAIKLARFSRRG